MTLRLAEVDPATARRMTRDGRKAATSRQARRRHCGRRGHTSASREAPMPSSCAQRSGVAGSTSGMTLRLAEVDPATARRMTRGGRKAATSRQARPQECVSRSANAVILRAAKRCRRIHLRDDAATGRRGSCDCAQDDTGWAQGGAIAAGEAARVRLAKRQCRHPARSEAETQDPPQPIRPRPAPRSPSRRSGPAPPASTAA